MKTTALIFLLFLNCTFLFCQNAANTVWKSAYSDLQLTFDSHWQQINPHLDSENKTLFGIIDKTDHSSVVVKITRDVPKDQLSDEEYEEAVKVQMLKGNSENKLLIHDKIIFKGIQFNRQIFFMKIKYGQFVSTDYVYRNGTIMIGIQFSYPVSEVKKYENDIPAKIEKILSDMKF